MSENIYINDNQLYGGMDVIKWKEKGEEMTIFLNGEIDHCVSETLRKEIERLIQERGVQVLVFDFSHVTFMDSSGIGMLIGRYKTIKSRGGKVFASGLKAPVARIYKMSGLHRIIALMEGGEEA